MCGLVCRCPLATGTSAAPASCVIATAHRSRAFSLLGLAVGLLCIMLLLLLQVLSPMLLLLLLLLYSWHPWHVLQLLVRTRSDGGSLLQHVPELSCAKLRQCAVNHRA